MQEQRRGDQSDVIGEELDLLLLALKMEKKGHEPDF